MIGVSPRGASGADPGYTAGVVALPLLLGMVSAFVAPFGDDALIAAAAASGRPPECAPSQRRGLAHGLSVWQLARVPNLQPYCDLVARAHAQLRTSPEAAKKSALKADAKLPGRAAPEVILGRAELGLGNPEAAAKHFARALSIDPRSLEDPRAMHDLAKAQTRTNQPDAALATYRALVTRASLLPDNGQRVEVLLEAAHASMAAAATAPVSAAAPREGEATSTRESLLEEAIACLREARRLPATELASDVLLSLALGLDRAGRSSQADAALVEVARTAAAPRPGIPDYLVVEDDKLLLDGLALAATDAKAARQKVEAYLAGAGGQGAWAEAARRRLQKLAAPAKPPPKKKP